MFCSLSEVLRQLPETYGGRYVGATVGATVDRWAAKLEKPAEAADGFLMRLQITLNNIYESANNISILYKQQLTDF